MTRARRNSCLSDQLAVSPSSFEVRSIFFSDNNVTRPFITSVSLKLSRSCLSGSTGIIHELEWYVAYLVYDFKFTKANRNLNLKSFFLFLRCFCIVWKRVIQICLVLWQHTTIPCEKVRNRLCVRVIFVRDWNVVRLIYVAEETQFPLPETNHIFLMNYSDSDLPSTVKSKHRLSNFRTFITKLENDRPQGEFNPTSRRKCLP